MIRVSCHCIFLILRMNGRTLMVPTGPYFLQLDLAQVACGLIRKADHGNNRRPSMEVTS